MCRKFREICSQVEENIGTGFSIDERLKSQNIVLNSYLSTICGLKSKECG